ncbi:MAG: hypothetical protein AB2787_08210 [Candidatus Thiodiazotropha endolucinida]
MEDLINACKFYFQELSNTQNPKITWNNGYYLSENKNLNKLEKYFLMRVNTFSPDFIEFVKNNINSPDSIYVVSLLGWSRDSEKIIDFVSEIVRSSNHELHNYYFRTLFPILVNGNGKIDIEYLIMLLKHKNTYCKNKALGTLAFIPLSEEDFMIIMKYMQCFLQYSKSKNNIISNPANILIKRINTCSNY